MTTVVALACVLAFVLLVAAPDSDGPQQPASSTATPSGSSELAFGSLKAPQGVAVDASGNVYVTVTGADVAENGVLMLSADGGTVTRLPFGGAGPTGLTVDQAGDVFATDYVNDRVLKLAPSAGQATEVPIPGLNRPGGVAVDNAGTLYVADTYNDRVLMTTEGDDALELPFTGLKKPSGVAVDTSGNVYVADTYNDRILQLTVGESEPVQLPFDGLRRPNGVAVDAAGNVYATSYGDARVAKLPAGQGHSTDLPFDGLEKPWGVAVDNRGNVYVADYGNNRVLKVPAS